MAKFHFSSKKDNQCISTVWFEEKEGRRKKAFLTTEFVQLCTLSYAQEKRNVSD